MTSKAELLELVANMSEGQCIELLSSLASGRTDSYQLLVTPSAFAQYQRTDTADANQAVLARSEARKKRIEGNGRLSMLNPQN